MKYKRSLYLLSLLYSVTEDNMKDKICELFKETVIATDEYQQLKKLYQTVSFLGFDGASKKEEIKIALQVAISEIYNPIENLKHMELLIHQTENELEKSEKLLSSLGFFDDDFIAIKSHDIEPYTGFYMAMANSICYYLLSQFGVGAIRNLTFNQKSGFQGIVKLVNQQYGNELFMSSQTPKTKSWKIVKCTFVQDNFITYDGYNIEYSEMSLSSMLQKVQVDEYSRISPYLFAANSSDLQATYMGIGNIVGIEAMNSLSLLDSEVITSLPVNAFRESFVANDLLRAIEKSLGTDSYCITPDDFVAALNRQRLSETVAKRRVEGKCIFCGKKTYTGIACKDHFSITNQQV